ncbi:cytochrome ubiquinol oxidase subunit I [Yimella sp. NH-Cas1]|uniref:cytochrome ubiquinol oxidase subunit I n=1 Tax=Yimella sp. NH-Cas1 TaxID=2917726 RepID=UPI001EFBED2E|nr:cytochrome ubiquinol oxidase subunit I [Yimella sp. NH-Cas1]
MDALDLARWQFAITTVYHFFFVPITIGMSAVVAGFHTAWLRTRNPEWLRLAKFFGKLFTINFALGLVTGIVQEFQFGMNWSAYSRFVGDIFGAPLAFEALLAFFLESTFLGLWIFGWGRIPEKLHVMCIWLVHIGTVLSAYFILAANSFMQNPVGFKYNESKNRAELTDFVAVLTNKVQLVTFPHVVSAAYMTGGAMVMGVGLWKLMKGRAEVDRGMYRKSARVGAWVTLVASVAMLISGDIQGKIMTDVQPMKMAAAEALYDTEQPASFSVFTIGSLDGSKEEFAVTVPKVLSFLATGDMNGEVAGINDLRRELPAAIAEKNKEYGVPEHYISPSSYVPNIPGSYWSFRFMIGLGMAAMAGAALVLWKTRKGGTPTSKLFIWIAVLTPFAPVFANSFGWIFTEIGRQPWLVYGVMTTETGLSTAASTADVAISLIVYTLLYAVLAVIEVKLFLDYIKKGAEPFEEPKMLEDDDQLAFAY